MYVCMYTAQCTWNSEQLKLARLRTKPRMRDDGNEPSYPIKYSMLLTGLNKGKTVSFLTKHVKMWG
jgi:hypothetical protein